MVGANVGVDCPLVGVGNAPDKHITLRFRLARYLDSYNIIDNGLMRRLVFSQSATGANKNLQHNLPMVGADVNCWHGTDLD